MLIETHFIISYSKFSIFKKKENSKFSKIFKIEKKKQNLEFKKKNWNFLKILVFFRILKTLNIFVCKGPEKVSSTSNHKKTAFYDEI